MRLKAATGDLKTASSSDGVLLIDKPRGPTSFDAVRIVRRALGLRKVGHTGTLDPLASGLLVVCLGQGTKLTPFLMDTEKRYTAQIALGAMTDTDDALGEVVEEAPVPKLRKSDIEEACAGFQGIIRQTPPVYSAIKSDGEPLYKKARRGETVNPQPREVVIHQVKLIGFSDKILDIEISCGKGTYIRSLARDLGRALGTLGHLNALRRLETSGFSLADALALDGVDAAARDGSLGSRVIDLKDALRTMPKAELSLQAQQHICNGRALPVEGISAPADIASHEHLALIGADGDLCAIAKIAGGQIRPIRVFK